MTEQKFAIIEINNMLYVTASYTIDLICPTVIYNNLLTVK